MACYCSVASGIGQPADDKRIADKPAHSISMSLSFHSYCLVMAFSQVNTWLPGVEVLRYDEHLQWLRKKLGSDQDSYTQYRWGLVGVANGKGGEVHIFIHNRNNSWAGNVSCD
jgi:hypothetical protein